MGREQKAKPLDLPAVVGWTTWISEVEKPGHERVIYGEPVFDEVGGLRVEGTYREWVPAKKRMVKVGEYDLRGNRVDNQRGKR